MSDNKKEESKEERRARLKAKLRAKMDQKRVGRMSKKQQKVELDKYCKKMGVSAEQMKQMKDQIEKLKNNIPYK